MAASSCSVDCIDHHFSFVVLSILTCI
jgi:hypothetical protein